MHCVKSHIQINILMETDDRLFHIYSSLMYTYNSSAAYTLSTDTLHTCEMSAESV